MTPTLNDTQNNINDGVKAYVERSLKILNECSEQAVPKEDVGYFKELLNAYFTAEDEEDKQAAFEGIVEILLQEPVTVSQMNFEHESGEELAKWKIFVGGRIKKYRKDAKLSQIDLAKKAGLQQSHISRLEQGMHSPSFVTLQKIADALGIDVSKLDPSA